LHSASAGVRQLLRHLLALFLLRILLRSREQYHCQISLAVSVLLVDQDFLRRRRESGEFGSNHVTALAGQGNLECAIYVCGSGIFFPGQRVGRTYDDSRKRNISRFHRAINLTERRSQTGR
jgi:hypothetical protein